MSHGGFPNSCEGNYRTIYPGDFNGDGRTDLLVWNYCSPSWAITYSTTVNSFTPPSTAVQYTSFPAPITNNGNPATIINAYEYFVDDFDGDGKSDIAVINHGTKFITIYYSIGNNNFIQSGFSIAVGNVLPSKGKIGDFNGDGHIDIMYGASLYQQYGIYFLNSNNGVVSKYNDYNKVTSITNGFNTAITADYNTLPELSTKALNTPLPHFNFYSIGIGNINDPTVINIQKPLSVTSIVKTDNAIGGSNATLYAYRGAQIHTQGKGFLGFMQLAVTDMTTKIKTESFYELDATNFKQSLLSETQASLIDLTTGSILKSISDKKFQY